ncbi:MAG TPA: tripartite tricarboxylate transporter substrate-binding protein, partial [Noviherbaspirillum sp.]|nr:tripartite tricarboxylate transporter substrate-binding protein [Noviherbaspirillum sp.]
MNRRHFLATLGVASMSSTSLLSTAWAASYPSSPVRIVVPYAAGGGADGVTRVVAQLLGERLKGSFIVDNRPGAGGVIGAQNVARADADGYTLLMAGNPELTITPHLLARAPYSVADAFTPIMLVAQSPNVFVGNPAGPRTLAALIEESRKRNAPISVGTPGIG